MSRVEHPLIAINGEMELGKTSTRLSLSTRYADAVLKAGGIPVGIPPVGGPSDLRRLLDNVDGVVLGGGDDLDLERIGRGPNHAAINKILPAKQDFDVELARAILARKKPVLAICFGMQLLAVVEGAPMLQHLPEDRPSAQEHRGGARHTVDVVEGTLVRRVLQVDRLEVVSRHHQAIADCPRGWRVAARDEQGLIEAIEHPDLPFALAVQWHPEQADEGSVNDRLFRALIGAAGVAAAKAAFGASVRT